MDSKIKTAPLKEQRPLISFAKRQKTKWLRLIIFVLCPLSIVLCPSCKENKWLDWKAQNDMWLEWNKTQPGVQVTSSGLQYKIIADPGAINGETKPNQTSTIICDYEIKLINGYTVYAEKYRKMTLSQEPPGVAEGCHKIHTHGDIILYVPAYLGYDSDKYNNDKYNDAEGLGTEGTTSYIPPYSTLIYKIHLCSVGE
jgi:FKBP-type peptidyl-prolyl cis-trans isomerase